MDDRDQSRHAQLVERIVATGECRLGRESLPPLIAAQMPAHLSFDDTLNLVADHPTVANGLVAAFEGERPESEPVLNIAALVLLHPLLGLVARKRRPEAHEKWIGEEAVEAPHICPSHLAQDQSPGL